MSLTKTWVYTRYRRDYTSAKNRQQFLEKRAVLDGCEVVGSSLDYGHFFFARKGFRQMMLAVKRGEIDTIYIGRLGDISRSDRRLFFFFRKLAQCGVVAYMPDRSLRDCANQYAFGRKIELLCAKKKGALPWR